MLLDQLCRLEMLKACRLRKSLPIHLPHVPRRQPRAYPLTMVHNVHAQPQKSPRVSSSASQQAAEDQVQDPQHACTCAEGMESHQGVYSLEIPFSRGHKAMPSLPYGQWEG